MIGTLRRSSPSISTGEIAATNRRSYCFTVSPEFNYPGENSFSCDGFRMYEFKIRRCTRGRSHDWTECPYAHPGEKARRRDPRRYNYSGDVCPDFRRGGCPKGDSCGFSHGVFECWLHPSKYRTQVCKDGIKCSRRVCFFAHNPEQLRILSPEGFKLPDKLRIESPEMNSVGELVSSVGSLGFSPNWRDSVFQPFYGVSNFGRTRGGWEEKEVWEMIMEELGMKLGVEKEKEKVNVMESSGPDLGWVSELVNTVS